MIKIVQGDCLKILPTLPKATMVWADPPDNLGVDYAGVSDKRDSLDYMLWLRNVLNRGRIAGGVFWLSYYHKYQGIIMRDRCMITSEWRQFIWRFTFGQHRHTDCGNGYRPILRLMHSDAKLYPDAIRVESARQKLGDKRADPRGRVPDDFFEFPDVGCRVIELGGAKKGQTFVSTEDAALASLCSWSNDCGYATGKYHKKKIKLHRIVAERMGLDMAFEVDHVDRDKLNNCRYNLRSATRTEQCRNISLRKDSTSGHTGVSYCNRDKRWLAHIQGKSVGRFATKIEAVAARVAAAREVFGEFDPAHKPYEGSDVWEFPRICGTHKERKKWHPNCHPKDLLRRMVLFSTKPGDLVIDLFAGTGNMLEVCKELDRDCIGIELSKFYCEKIRELI